MDFIIIITGMYLIFYKFFIMFLVYQKNLNSCPYRCGIGTLGRNRSRAGSVDDTQLRDACRSVTPTSNLSSTPFQDNIAFTLPRNFETKNNFFVHALSNNSLHIEGDEHGLRTKCNQSSIQGMQHKYLK